MTVSPGLLSLEASATLTSSSWEDGVDSVLSMQQIGKSFQPGVPVLRDIALHVQSGQTVCLLGPSGCGKTTLLRLIAGFEMPDQGEIYLIKRLVSRPGLVVPPEQRHVGMVFQDYALFPHMTVSQNIQFGLFRWPLAWRRTRLAEMLRLVDLEAMARRYPHELSGGQQQRVALARALVFNPKVILMDEPLGALDKNLRDQMQYEIKHIHEKLGVTIVYVTHDQSEALVMSDRIAVFNDGMIQQISTPSDLYEQPQNTFVAQFIGENNRLTGKVSDIDGQLCWVDLDGGAKVKALAVNVKSRGSATSLMLRPERVMLNPVEMECPNIFEARVEEVVYIGKYLRARLFVCGTDQFIVMLPNSSDRRQLKRGEIVNVGWRANDCRALEPS